MTPLLKDQLATQEIRINEAGNNAYQDYVNPKETGTIFKEQTMAMFDKEKYREPSMQECIDGLQFELLTPTGWVKGRYPYVLEANPELHEFDGDDKMKLAHAITRVEL